MPKLPAKRKFICKAVKLEDGKTYLRSPSPQRQRARGIYGMKNIAAGPFEARGAWEKGDWKNI